MELAEKKFVEVIRTYYGKRLFNDNGSRVEAVLAGKNPPPYEVELQPSARCNANCRWCFGREFRRCEEKLYSGNAMAKVVNEIISFQQNGFEVETLKLCGSTGDPLVNPLALQAIEMAHGKKSLRLFTNGLALGDAQRRADAIYLKTIGKVDSINLSLDAATTETLHRIKPGSAGGIYGEGVALEDILKAAAMIRERGSHIEASFVATNENYFEIAAFAKKVKEYGAADSIRYRRDMTDVSLLAAHSEDIVELIKKAKEYEDEKFKVIQIHSDEAIRQTDENAFGSKGCGYKCFTARFWTCVMPDGNVVPCGHIASAYAPSYGNLIEQSFQEIWNNPGRKAINDSLPGDQCKICSPFGLATNEAGKILEELKITPEQFRKLHDKYSGG